MAFSANGQHLGVAIHSPRKIEGEPAIWHIEELTAPEREDAGDAGGDLSAVAFGPPNNLFASVAYEEPVPGGRSLATGADGRAVEVAWALVTVRLCGTMSAGLWELLWRKTERLPRADDSKGRLARALHPWGDTEFVTGAHVQLSFSPVHSLIAVGTHHHVLIFRTTDGFLLQRLELNEPLAGAAFNKDGVLTMLTNSGSLLTCQIEET